MLESPAFVCGVWCDTFKNSRKHLDPIYIIIVLHHPPRKSCWWRNRVLSAVFDRLLLGFDTKNVRTYKKPRKQPLFDFGDSRFSVICAILLSIIIADFRETPVYTHRTRLVFVCTQRMLLEIIQANDASTLSQTQLSILPGMRQNLTNATLLMNTINTSSLRQPPPFQGDSIANYSGARSSPA